jgi:hypothetical protein
VQDRTAGPTDRSPWTEVVRRTEVRGRKSSDGQKSVDGSPTNGSPTYVGRVELHRCCGDGGQRHCTAAMQARVAQRGDAVATHVAKELRHCFCSSRRSSVATLLLQHQSQKRSDAVVAGVVATLLQLALLRQCCNRRCNNAAALLQARSNGEEQRDGVAASARGKGRRPYTAL